MYSIGIDFGTLSARAVLLDLQTGEVKAQGVFEYPHGVLDTRLPDGTVLPPDWALQHPGDYLQALETVVSQVASQTDPARIVGISLDFTASTVLPVDGRNMPLCLQAAWRDQPHAWVKLWKHHGAQKQADRMARIARERGEPFLQIFGGKISSEMGLPKILETLECAPEVYAAADQFVEAGDWLTQLLTGERVRSACLAGYKYFWNKKTGYPSSDYLKAVDPRLEHLAEEKLQGTVRSPCTKAGSLTGEMAKKLGLRPGIAVGVPYIDAHAGLPAVGITEPGELLMIIGTSSCDMVMGQSAQPVPGICGVVEDGLLPGYYGYEAGQSCVGDLFAWFVEHCVPEEYAAEAAARQLSLHQLLTEKAERQKPGQSGLLALDWWGGNRSVLMDSELSGMILGMTLATKPEELYRALIEATAYGKRMILENYEQNGIPIRRLYATGGIARKNAMMMQIYADVTGKEIFIGGSDQSGAVSSAMVGAVAAGAYDSMQTAIRKIGRVDARSYRPDPEHQAVYDRLYAQFCRLHDYFGRGENNVMKTLRQLRRQAAEETISG